jgi:hypothetical protein
MMQPTVSQGAMQPFLDIFANLADARADELRARHGLVVKASAGLGAAIIKLLKPSWTTDAPELFLNTNGLFFSVWVDEACVAHRRARFNLHAKKLRSIKGEAFPAREFARSFRAEAGDALKAWPAIVYPKGPITLFEGHVPLHAQTLHAETSALLDRFIEMLPLIDRMLAAEPRGKIEPVVDAAD